MAKIIENSSKKLVLKAYPKCMVGLSVGFLAILGLASVLQNLDAEFKDYVIFIGVALVMICIQKHQLTTLNKSTGYGEVVTTTILGSKSFNFKLADVQDVMMVYGRGQYAKGSAIGVELGSQQPTIIADSDICFGNRERNIRLQEEIMQWL